MREVFITASDKKTYQTLWIIVGVFAVADALLWILASHWPTYVTRTLGVLG